MPRQLTLVSHLSLKQLERRYRKSLDPVERSQWQIIWLLASGKATKQVAEVVGYSIGWIRTIAKRYNAGGEEAIGDRRHQNPGREPLLDEQQQAFLLQALQEEPAEGGKWTGAKVARWMSEQLSRKIAPQRGWEYLKALEYGLKVPRPSHVKGDIEEQQQWKKNSTRIIKS